MWQSPSLEASTWTHTLCPVWPDIEQQMTVPFTLVFCYLPSGMKFLFSFYRSYVLYIYIYSAVLGTVTVYSLYFQLIPRESYSF